MLAPIQPIDGVQQSNKHKKVKWSQSPEVTWQISIFMGFSSAWMLTTVKSELIKVKWPTGEITRSMWERYNYNAWWYNKLKTIWIVSTFARQTSMAACINAWEDFCVILRINDDGINN